MAGVVSLVSLGTPVSQHQLTTEKSCAGEEMQGVVNRDQVLVFDEPESLDSPFFVGWYGYALDRT